MIILRKALVSSRGSGPFLRGERPADMKIRREAAGGGRGVG